MMFRNRREAGRMLARELVDLKGRDVIVLALPRGGVPVALEVALALRAPLDVLVVRKVAFPDAPEYAMGAVASGGVRVRNPDAWRLLRLVPRNLEAELERAAAAELEEVRRREKLYRRRSGPPDVKGKIAVLVDDGLATGSTMEAAILAVRSLEPARVIVAVPVGPEDTCRRLGELAEVVCPTRPAWFPAIGTFYRDFSQLTDEEVQRLLNVAEAPLRTG